MENKVSKEFNSLRYLQNDTGRQQCIRGLRLLAQRDMLASLKNSQPLLTEVTTIGLGCLIIAIQFLYMKFFETFSFFLRLFLNYHYCYKRSEEITGIGFIKYLDLS